MSVVLDNTTAMTVDSGKRIEGGNKESSEGGSDKSEACLTVEPCRRFEELQDTCIFLLKLAATCAFPISFDLFMYARKFGERGGGFRRVAAPDPNGTKTKAEDYIPLEEQVDSALGLIENFSDVIDYGAGSFIKRIGDIKTQYEEEILDIEREEKRIAVVIIASNLPWGRQGGDDEYPEFRRNFIKMLDEFADIPVTFVFIVESSDDKIIHFYDEISSHVKADVKVAKGLGLMIDGISKHNPWLNYCLPMHLMQSLGVGSNTISQAASRPLKADEVKEVCELLIGEVPDPAAEVECFLARVANLMSDENHVKWSPITGEKSPFFDSVKLKEHMKKRFAPAGVLASIFVCILAIILGHFFGQIKLGQ